MPAGNPSALRGSGRLRGCLTLLVVAAVVVLTPVGWLVYAWYDFSRPPGVVAHDRWPAYLREHVDEWRRAGVDVDGIEVFATDPLFNDAAYCRLPDSPETWVYLQARYAEPRKGTEEDARQQWEAVRQELPDWAPNLDDSDVEILPAYGHEEASQIRLARDPGRRTIYVDYYFNF